MNPRYLWLTDAIQLLTFFVVGPVLAIANRVYRVAGENTRVQLRAVRNVVRRVRRDGYSAVRVREMVERRCQKPLIFPATGRYAA